MLKNMFCLIKSVNLLNKIIIMATKKKKTTAETISDSYMDFVLTNGKMPNSVYEFAKSNGFEENEFYQFFASFEQIEQDFFKQMFHYTLLMIQKSDNYESYDAKQKLSVFYFTFFEVATANRSFINYLLVQEKNKLKSLSKLKSLRNSFLEFVKSILENPIKSDIEKFNKVQNKVLIEGAWSQFLSILKYFCSIQYFGTSRPAVASVTSAPLSVRS